MQDVIDALNEAKNKLSSADIDNGTRCEIEDEIDSLIEKCEGASDEGEGEPDPDEEV